MITHIKNSNEDVVGALVVDRESMMCFAAFTEEAEEAEVARSLEIARASNAEMMYILVPASLYKELELWKTPEDYVLMARPL